MDPIFLEKCKLLLFCGEKWPWAITALPPSVSMMFPSSQRKPLGITSLDNKTSPKMGLRSVEKEEKIFFCSEKVTSTNLFI